MLLLWYQLCCQVTLIDQGERFIFKPLLYELINGTAQSWEVAPTFTQLLAQYPIQFIQVSAVKKHCSPCAGLALSGLRHSYSSRPGQGIGGCCVTCTCCMVRSKYAQQMMCMCRHVRPS